MIDLRLTDAEKEAMVSPSPMGYPSVPDYPYGMCICIPQSVIEKLKMQPMKPGATVEFSVSAFVANVGVDDDGKPCNVSLQIREMDTPEVTKDAEKVMYG